MYMINLINFKDTLLSYHPPEWIIFYHINPINSLTQIKLLY